MTSIENANLSLKWESSSRKLRDTTQIATQRQKILGTAPYLLLVNANGDYDRTKALLRGDSIPNVFYLKDGLNGYDAYLKRLAALREHAPPPPSNQRCGLAPR